MIKLMHKMPSIRYPTKMWAMALAACYSVLLLALWEYGKAKVMGSRQPPSPAKKKKAAEVEPTKTEAEPARHPELYVSSQGKKYHNSKSCFGLKHAREIMELKPCPICCK